MFSVVHSPILLHICCRELSSVSYSGKTSGLLGYFDNDKEKEFLLPDGTFLKTSSKAATLHYEFGLKCKDWITVHLQNDH